MEKVRRSPAKHGLRLPFLTGLVVGVVGTAILGALLAFLLFPLVLKHRTSSPLEDRLGTNRVLAAIPRADKRARNPLPATSEVISAGAAQYAANCLICHGADGRADTPIGRNMFPPAADLLSERVRNMTEGEIAWIARNGLSFVGMPAFETLMSDEQIWQTVRYIESLQQGGPPAAGGRPAPAGPAPAAGGQQAPGAQAPAAGGGQQAPAPAGQGAPEQAAAAKALFAAKGCAACHGADAQGGVGPRLAGTSRSFSYVQGVVRSGRGSMPSFSPAAASDEELHRIYDWLRGGSGGS